MVSLSKMSPYELGETGRAEAVRYLILYLSRGTANEKRLAASAIGKLSSKHKDTCREAITFLVENLSDSHPQVRQYTLKALGKFELPQSAYESIKEITLKDSMEYNRRAAEDILKNVRFILDEEVALTKTEKTDAVKAPRIEFNENFQLEGYSKKEEKFIELLNEKCGIKFTEKQKGAVMHKERPALVLAVPGAGKTTVLLARTANLIINHGVNPANILSITFSRASALDMKNRYNSIFSNITSIGANFSTIHSFAFELIRKYSSLHGLAYKVIEDTNSGVNKRALLKKCYFDTNGEQLDEDALDELINNIGYVKNMILTDKELEGFASELELNNFVKIYSEYEKIKKDNGFIDYDDMLSMAFDILKEDRDTLERYRKLYKYIQVDEGQDTSKIQHKLIQLIAYPENNIFVVADDDQSIYSFRGAYPKFLLEFENMYPGTKKFYIEENFRSTKEIVDLANKFIKTNTVRFDKTLFTNNGEGNPVRVVRLKNENEMVDFLIQDLKELKANGDSAILYRNNISAIGLADELSRRGVTFYIKDYNRFFFKHFVTEDIKAFMEFILDQSDINAFSRIYYKINSYLPKEIVHYLKTNNPQGNSVFTLLEKISGNNENLKSRIIRLRNIFNSLRTLNVKTIISSIENELGYNKFLKENAKMLGYSYESLRIILTNLKDMAGRCKSIAAFLNRIPELEDIMDKSRSKRENSILTLSTIHSSKGLEFSDVYIIDIIDNIIPTRGSLEKLEKGNIDRLEEERRLMYVAMTRARKRLNLLMLERKNDEVVIPSRFISEILSSF
jgi:DNA helicase II / ATP-dependent DNA helicase PcrA